MLAHLDELGPAFEIRLHPAERYFGHSELEPQAIEEPVVDGVESRRQVEADQDCLSSAAVKTPSRTSSNAVSVECPFLYVNWNWLKLAELSRWGRRRANTSLPRTLDHANTPPLSFFTGRMTFLPPNQQRQSTEG